MEIFSLMLVMIGSGFAIYLVPKIFFKLVTERRTLVKHLSQSRHQPSLKSQKAIPIGPAFRPELYIPTYQRKGVQVQLTEILTTKATPVEIQDQLDEIRLHLMALMGKKESTNTLSRRGTKSKRKVELAEKVCDLVSPLQEEANFEIIA